MSKYMRLPIPNKYFILLNWIVLHFKRKKYFKNENILNVMGTNGSVFPGKIPPQGFPYSVHKKALNLVETSFISHI